MSYLIYSIFKVLIPLYRQMKYEERKGSQLVECMKFKYKRLLQLYIFFGICSILIFVSPFIEKLLIDLYLYDFIFHYTFQILMGYENVIQELNQLPNLPNYVPNFSASHLEKKG